MLYVYAITECDRIPGILGLHGAPVRTVGKQGLFAVVSDHDELQLEPNEDELWAHENVVEDLMDRGSVLPMRFGSGLADDGAVIRVLDERRSELATALERVRGAVELSVRLAIASEPESLQERSPASDQAGPGTAYLLDRLRHERHENEMTSQIHEHLASLARASTSWSGDSGRRLWKAAYLVSDERLDAFAEQVNSLDTQLNGGTVLCTGPWPPYSFSSGGATS